MNVPYFSDKFRDRVIALDIETTGAFKGEKNRIIQLGVVEFNNGKFVRQHVKLFGGGKSTPFCLKIHNIKDSDRDGCPTFESCCANVAKYLSNSIIVGHNVASCDMRIINGYMDELGLKIENYKLIDTYKLAKEVLPLKKFNLELCCAELGLDFGKHDALGDAKSSLLVLDQIVKRRQPFDKEDFFV